MSSMSSLQALKTRTWCSIPCSVVSSFKLWPEEKTGPAPRSTTHRVESFATAFLKWTLMNRDPILQSIQRSLTDWFWFHYTSCKNTWRLVRLITTFHWHKNESCILVCIGSLYCDGTFVLVSTKASNQPDAEGSPWGKGKKNVHDILPLMSFPLGVAVTQQVHYKRRMSRLAACTPTAYASASHLYSRYVLMTRDGQK